MSDGMRDAAGGNMFGAQKGPGGKRDEPQKCSVCLGVGHIAIARGVTGECPWCGGTGTEGTP